MGHLVPYVFVSMFHSEQGRKELPKSRDENELLSEEHKDGILGLSGEEGPEAINDGDWHRIHTMEQNRKLAALNR